MSADNKGPKLIEGHMHLDARGDATELGIACVKQMLRPIAEQIQATGGVRDSLGYWLAVSMAVAMAVRESLCPEAATAVAERALATAREGVVIDPNTTH